jgi:hypothetical protein
MRWHQQPCMEERSVSSTRGFVEALQAAGRAADRVAVAPVLAGLVLSHLVLLLLLLLSPGSSLIVWRGRGPAHLGRRWGRRWCCCGQT